MALKTTKKCTASLMPLTGQIEFCLHTAASTYTNRATFPVEIDFNFLHAVRSMVRLSLVAYSIRNEGLQCGLQ